MDQFQPLNHFTKYPWQKVQKTWGCGSHSEGVAENEVACRGVCEEEYYVRIWGKLLRWYRVWMSFFIKHFQKFKSTLKTGSEYACIYLHLYMYECQYLVWIYVKKFKNLSKETIKERMKLKRKYMHASIYNGAYDPILLGGLISSESL